eukprot:COSAG02_NODE_9581_length_2171_cov_1.445463_1_plen_159_part_00
MDWIWSSQQHFSEHESSVLASTAIASCYSCAVRSFLVSLVCWVRSWQVAGAFSASKPIALPACAAHDFQLHHIAQVFKVGSRNLALLGEPSKWVPIAARRIVRVTVRKSSASDLTAHLVGSCSEFDSRADSMPGKLPKSTRAGERHPWSGSTIGRRSG